MKIKMNRERFIDPFEYGREEELIFITRVRVGI